MNDLIRKVIEQEVARQLDEQKEELQEALFQGCGERDTPEEIYTKMIINGIYFSVTLAADMAIGILLRGGAEPRSEEELRRQIFSVCKDEEKQITDAGQKASHEKERI